MSDDRHQRFTVEQLDPSTLRISARTGDMLFCEILKEVRSRPERDRDYRLGDMAWDIDGQQWVALVHFGRPEAPGDNAIGSERYPAFAVALTDAQRGTPEWRAISAGLMTLELIDLVLEAGAPRIVPPAFGLKVVRAAVNGLQSDTGVRALLTAVLDMVERPSRTHLLATVAPRLMAYARELQHDGRWALAADVCRALVARLEPRDGFDMIINAHLQLARCLRRLASWQEAAEAVWTARTLASVSGNRAGELRAQTIQAELAVDRGNMPEAQAILDEVVAAARGAHLTEVLSAALLSRSGVAYRRRDYAAAIADASEAIQSSADSTIRYRCLNDIAVSFQELGVLEGARDAWSIVAARADEHAVRMTAAINLVELSIREGNEFAFEQQRRRLAGASLTPVQTVYLDICLGQGYARFGRHTQARIALERAVSLAERHGLNEFVINAEQALTALPDGGVVIIATSESQEDGTSRYDAVGESSVPAGVWAAAGKIKDLRLAMSGAG